MSVHVVAIHQDEILTGEAVALDVQPLGLIMRGLGTLIDAALSWALFIGMLLAYVYLLVGGAASESVAPIVSVASIVLAFVIVPTVVETATGGRSLGKLAVGGRIVRSDGGASGFRQAFIRSLVGFLEIYLTVGGMAFLIGAFTPRAQRLGDLLAGTYSERTRTPKINESERFLPPVLSPWSQTVDVARLPDRLARRIAQFLDKAPSLMPGARVRLASELAAEANPYVLPVPPVDPETFLRGLIAVRRDREYRALTLQNQRTASLTVGL